jgi:hypothetical protein
MILYRQGKPVEARKLASAAAATMTPQPSDENNPQACGAGPDQLIVWLAYKEAQALIPFEAPPPAKAETCGNPPTT